MKSQFFNRDFAHFTELLVMSVHLVDSDITSSAYSSICSEQSHGARDADALSSGSLTRLVAFVELRADRAISARSLARDAEDPRASKRKHGVLGVRSNPVFINKFTRHGNRQRSAKGYARALAAILAFAKRSSYGKLDRLVSLWRGTPRSLSDELLAGRLLILYFGFGSVATLQSSKLHKSVGGLFFENASVLNTELVYKNLLRITPLYSMKLTRIPKQRYKNIRNKVSHYEMRPYLIKKEASVSYWFRYAKYSWNFSSQRSYLGKYVKLLYETAMAPGLSAGYVAGKNVYIKKLYK